MADDIVHIGYYKTASSSLQKLFFPALPGCTFVTGWGPDSKVYRPLAESLRHAEEDDYLGETLQAFLAETRRDPSSPLFLSDEHLCGAVLKGGYNWERNAERVHALLPGAKILVVVRSQATMLPSIYSLYVQTGGVASFSDLLTGRAPSGRVDPDQLRYDRVVARYQELFGSKRVKVVPYELLLSDARRFFTEVGSWAAPGVPLPEPDLALRTLNRSLSPPLRGILRRWNRLFRRSGFNPKPLIAGVPGARKMRTFLQSGVDPLLFRRVPRRLGRADAAMVDSLLPGYEESNAELERLTGLSLGGYGYPLAVDSSSEARATVPARS